jgi:putative glutamine amidotransferase
VPKNRLALRKELGERSLRAMKGRPVIGITAYEEDARWGPWSERAVLVPATYVEAVEKAGGAAVVLPIQSKDLESLLGRVDGLVLSGGPDVDPDRYGESLHPRSDQPRVERDEFELALVDQAAQSDTPMLAICRGMQILNVARGGDLHQHLPEIVGHAGHSPTAGEYAQHQVDVLPASQLAAILKGSVVDAASHHHQAIDHLGAGLRVSASAQDGTIEAVEDPRLAYFIGVQWHPEVGGELTLFEGLVEAADHLRSGAPRSIEP